MYRSAFILAAVLLGVTAGAIVPATLSLRRIRAEITQERAVIEEQYAQRSFLRQTVANLQQIRGSTQLLNQYAIREGQELRFVQSLEDIAAANGVEQYLQLETANQREITPWQRVIPVTVRVRGDFADVVRYFRATEQLPYHLQFTSIAMQPINKSTKVLGGELEATMSGEVHWLGNDAPAFVFGEDL